MVNLLRVRLVICLFNLYFWLWPKQLLFPNYIKRILTLSDTICVLLIKKKQGSFVIGRSLLEVLVKFLFLSLNKENINHVFVEEIKAFLETMRKNKKRGPNIYFPEDALKNQVGLQKRYDRLVKAGFKEYNFRSKCEEIDRNENFLNSNFEEVYLSIYFVLSLDAHSNLSAIRDQTKEGTIGQRFTCMDLVTSAFNFICIVEKLSEQKSLLAIVINYLVKEMRKGFAD